VFFSHPALIALAITLLVLPGVALFSGGNLSPGVREDRSNRWVIATFGLIGLLAAYLPPTERGSGRSTEMISAGLASSSSLLAPRRRSGQSLCSARRFSGLAAIQRGHTLVTSGVSGVIPHPSYLGLLVNSVGWALAFRSEVGVLLTALLVPPLLARIRAEERLLRTYE
jgi:protein-S-isoprenylcysteine O-methyltransferase Ste14